MSTETLIWLQFTRSFSKSKFLRIKFCFWSILYVWYFSVQSDDVVKTIIVMHHNLLDWHLLLPEYWEFRWRMTPNFCFCHKFSEKSILIFLVNLFNVSLYKVFCCLKHLPNCSPSLGLISKLKAKFKLK